MSRSSARVSAAAIGLTALGVAALVALPGGEAGPGAAPSSTSTVETVPSTAGSPTTTGVPVFVDGEDARAAAEDLIATYIATEYGETVTDAACSVPPTGAVGERFACYALKNGDLVIALRATVADERLIELELILDQEPTTVATVVPIETTG